MTDYRVSRAAQADIRSIGRYTQRTWSVEQRRKYLSGMDRRFQALAESPLLAAEHKEYDPPVRIFPYQRNLIVYRIEGSGIFILRVLHENMDVPGHLSGA